MSTPIDWLRGSGATNVLGGALLP
ncbi:MAG: hypothetical protein JWO24_2576, partial [Rhodospirillales bacterium]|nr:hypothetical protein [Rhodospirillales bacterium]